MKKSLTVIEHDEPETAKGEASRQWFIGAYVTREIKNALKDEARKTQRTSSQLLSYILTERYQLKEHKENGKT